MRKAFVARGGAGWKSKDMLLTSSNPTPRESNGSSELFSRYSAVADCATTTARCSSSLTSVTSCLFDISKLSRKRGRDNEGALGMR